MERKQLFFEDINVGDEIAPLVREITVLQIIQYAGVMWIPALFHVNKEFAQKQGFRDMVAQGPLNCAFVIQQINSWMGEEGHLKKTIFEYRAVSYPGDVVTCKGKVQRKYRAKKENFVECKVWVENQKKQNIISGIALITLPSKMSMRWQT